MRLSAAALLSLALVACSGDDGSSTESTSQSASATATTTTTTTAATTDPSTTDVGSTTGPTTDTTTDATTGDATTTTTSDTTTDESTSSTTGVACDPPVVGGYNDCTDDQGKVDNKLCKYIGTGQSVGFLSCLNSGGVMGASTCTIIQCVDDCDCFNPPATGTAKSVCKPMATDKGDAACLLDCSDGATCPDGMVCDNDNCFWPPP